MLQCHGAKSPEPCVFTALRHCPHCGDRMVAPVISEFMQSGEIRHHWECESCGHGCVTTVPPAAD
jgi:hypothetical protein